jgi:hypothetical protein
MKFVGRSIVRCKTCLDGINIVDAKGWADNHRKLGRIFTRTEHQVEITKIEKGK